MDNLFESNKEKYATISAYFSLAAVVPLLFALTLVTSKSLCPKWLLSLRSNFTAVLVFLVMSAALVLNVLVLSMKGIEVNANVNPFPN